ncbi:MAG: COX15/CtaA family protein, partial [Psychrobium sp.]|nr:COX15/CtaA family protein [Psychrobium sp.]
MNALQNQDGRLKTLVLIATCFSLIVIALGAYTRLVHAGLGCPDWPLCYGHVWAPQAGAEISSANVNFPDTPVDLEKTWPEMTHRYLASSLGLFCIIILALSILNRRKDKEYPVKHALFLLALVIAQGLFGMWTVTLKLWPQVVTGHLIGGFTTFCTLLLLFLRLYFRNRDIGFSSIHMRLWCQRIAVLTLLLCIGQVILGGWLTSNYAAMACVKLPFCSLENITNDDFYRGFNVM